MGILSCDELKERIAAGALLVDVRTQREFDQVRLHGASLIPANAELPTKIAEIATRDTDILLYCRTGARSGQVQQFLRQQGYNAHNIGGVVHYMQCLEY